MSIQPHNERAAATWGSGGAGYDLISECIANSIEHMLNRVNAQPGERVLDLATGTGWTARRLAQKGAVVTGVDIGAGVIEAARNFAAQANLAIDFRVGDAEAVDLPTAAFDVITSTCGVMFASRPEAVSGELARLLRPSGRLALTTWLPTSTLAGMFAMMRPFMPPPPANAPPSPFEWGRPERLHELLDANFDLTIEPGCTVLRVPTGEDAWKMFSEGYGPTRMLLQNTDRKAELRQAFVAFHDAHRTPAGIAMPRDYLVTIGRRK